MSRSAHRTEQSALAARLRGAGAHPRQIGRELRERYGLNGRQAQRIAHGWTQDQAASAWSARWPDDPKTFKSISYWELWPASTGHAPSLAVLDRLAELYRCDAADLLADWGCHAEPTTDDGGGSGPAALAWQAEHLSLHELAQSVGAWSERLPDRQRRTVLLKLGTATSIVTSAMTDTPGRRALSVTPAATPLIGRWSSSCSYESTSRGRSFTGTHVIDLRRHEGRLVGHSQPQPSGSVLDLDLVVEGSLITGTWTERTSPSGHYRAATFHGVLHLVVDPTGHTMIGRWLGVSRRYTIKSGEWRLDRQPASAGPVTTATTVDPQSNSPSATLA